MEKNNLSLDSTFLKDFERFVKEFKSESERGAVIYGSAQLENQLYQLLKKVFIESPTKDDRLFDSENAPLSTFNSKIDIAYRLGLIDEEFKKALHLIRKIRNSFAHEINDTSLTFGKQSDRVKELFLPFKEFVMFKDFRKENFENKNDLATDFRLVLCITLVRLEYAIKYSDCFKSRENPGYTLLPLEKC